MSRVNVRIQCLIASFGGMRVHEPSIRLSRVIASSTTPHGGYYARDSINFTPSPQRHRNTGTTKFTTTDGRLSICAPPWLGLNEFTRPGGDRNPSRRRPKIVKRTLISIIRHPMETIDLQTTRSDVISVKKITLYIIHYVYYYFHIQIGTYKVFGQTDHNNNNLVFILYRQ